MAHPGLGERRLAEVYDRLNPDRSDLDAYVAMVGEFGAESILDVGCGTGTFACLLAKRGLAVTRGPGSLRPAPATFRNQAIRCNLPATAGILASTR